MFLPHYSAPNALEMILIICFNFDCVFILLASQQLYGAWIRVKNAITTTKKVSSMNMNKSVMSFLKKKKSQTVKNNNKIQTNKEMSSHEIKISWSQSFWLWINPPTKQLGAFPWSCMVFLWGWKLSMLSVAAAILPLLNPLSDYRRVTRFLKNSYWWNWK